MKDTYSHRQVQSILRSIGVPPQGETFNDFTVFCPFHGNRDTPAMTVSVRSGMFCCFSPECGESGSLSTLIQKVTGKNEFGALRMIIKAAGDTQDNFEEELSRVLMEAEPLKEFSQTEIDRLEEARQDNETAENYMLERGFDIATLDHFHVGFSNKMMMVTVPLYDVNERPLGFVGRSVNDKIFKNSGGLPKSKTLFNLHNAKKHTSAIICEASFDVMKLHQAGYPNGVAILGGTISDEQISQLNRHFTRVIIATDFDDKAKHIKDKCRRCYPEKCEGHNPGRDLGNTIISRLRNKETMWAVYDDDHVFPPGCKDITDMNEDQIRQFIQNAKYNYEYALLDLY